jgi:hypothetical protein
MRAAASKLWFLARNWQSQRVTRRSGRALGRAGRAFQPVPSQRGQTSASVLISFNFANLSFEKPYRLTLHLQTSFLQVSKPPALCTTCEATVRPVEG